MVFVSLIDSVPELLYKHNCVIIPGFGGFITNFKHSGFEESRNLISPSCKKVAFNQSLIENDGLLVNSWAQLKSISYKEALIEIASFSEFLKERIVSNKSFDFKNIGTFYLNSEDRIIFVPYQGLNFLESSFGLFPVKIKPLNVQPVVSIAEPTRIQTELIAEPLLLTDKSPNRVIQFRNSFMLKAASVVLVAGVSAFSIYYLINDRNKTTSVKDTKSEQHASIISIDSNNEKQEKTKPITLINLEYVAERQKINEIKTQLDSFKQNNITNQETYNVVMGYYATEAATKKILSGLINDYPNAILAEKTSEGYGIIVETFYKHTTANAFSVMLKQNGLKNIKVEKQIVIQN